MGNYYILALWEYGNQKIDTRKVAVTIFCVMRNAHYVDERKKFCLTFSKKQNIILLNE